MINKEIREKTPRNLLFLFELLALFLLFIYQKDNLDKLTFLTGISLVLVIYLSNYLLSKITTGDNYIFQIITMLISIGTIMIYRIDEKLGVKQLIWICIGIFMFFATYLLLKYIKHWSKLIYLYLGGSYFLFLLTFILGDRKNGAINWINIGDIVSFQPAEITKILLIFLVAAYYWDIEKWKKIKHSSYFLMAIVYSFIVLLFLQRDLGTALVFYTIFIVIQFIYEEDRKLILCNLGLFSVGAFAGYTLFDHVKIRFQSWLDPWKYIDRQGYQITQSLFAIAEGGFFGNGLGLGYPDFIPVVYTDFIFSAICEEMGIFTGIGVIMLFMIFVYRGFKISIAQDHGFYKILGLGISTLFGIQAFIILGGVLNMIPLTGLTLPFISYGGSSLVTSFVALGILQVCSEELDIEETKNE